MAMNQQQIQQLVASGQISPQELQQAFQDMEAYNTANNWIASQGGTNGAALARDPNGTGMPMTPRPSGIVNNSQYDPYQSHLSGPQQNPLAVDPNHPGAAAEKRLIDMGIIDPPKGGSMLGQLRQFGTKFVLPAALGYLGGNALMGTGPFAAGAGGLFGGSGTTQLAGGAGADTLGGSSVFGGTTSGTTAASPFGVGSGGSGTSVFGGTAGASASVNPFAGPGYAGLSSGTGAAAGGSGTGSGAFSWLKGTGDALFGTAKTIGLLPSIKGYFSSRDAANTMSRATDSAAARADPFASERSGYQDMLGQMMTNPNYMMQDPSYNFRVQQGQDALERSNAARGYLGSGNMNFDLQKYGQDMASQEYGNQYKRLSELAGVNAGSPAVAGQTYGQGMTNVANQNQQTAGSLGNMGRSIYDNWPQISQTAGKIFGSSA